MPHQMLAISPRNVLCENLCVYIGTYGDIEGSTGVHEVGCLHSFLVSVYRVG